jgi:hypothetical protein
MDLLELTNRKKLIDEIKGLENKGRREESVKQVEIFNDRLGQYVYEKLREKYSKNTVREMPVIQSINLARRIVKQEASVYQEQPDRFFSDLDDDQLEAINNIYKDMGADFKLKKSNESYKLQSQNHVMIVPKDGKLLMRVLRNHHVDSIPDPMDPETAMGYVISAFDKSMILEDHTSDTRATGYVGDSRTFETDSSNRKNEMIGDEDDYKSLLERYVVWTKDLNFIMDGKGNILSEETENPIGMLPIIDISIEKDFEYWVRQGEAVTGFTVDYNCLLSSLAQIMHMQGFSQAYMIAGEETIAENIVIGPNHILKLPIGVDGSRPEFGFASPSADLQGSIQLLETTLANFLSSRGIDPDTISGSLQSNTSTSGVQELLRMIKQFKATKDDFAIYENAEAKVYEIVKAWHNVAIGTDLLDPKYTSREIGETSEISVLFHRPEMQTTEQERLDAWEKKINMGAASRVDMLMDIYNLDKDEAQEKALEIDEVELGGNQEESNQNLEVEQVSELGEDRAGEEREPS